MARILLSSGLMTTVTSPFAYAGVWNVSGHTLVGGGYDDNVSLTPTNTVAAEQFIADVSGTLAYQDNANSFVLSPRVLTVRYDAEKELNRTDPSVTLQATRANETGNTNVSLAGTQDTTLTSEPGLTGLAVNKKHRMGSLTAGRSWNATERIEIDTQLYGSVSRYVDAQGTGLVGYNYGSAALSGGYAWTERSTLTTQLSIGELKVPDQPNYDKTNLSATLGYKLKLSSRWLAEFSFGPSQIRANGRTELGTVYNASVSQNSELMTFNLGVTRDVTPNGLGLLSRRDQVQFGVSRRLTERWTTDWAAAWIRNQDVLPEGGLALDDVKYADITGNLRWNMTPTWSVSISAGFTRQTTGIVESIATRKHASLNLNWNSLSRTLN